MRQILFVISVCIIAYTKISAQSLQSDSLYATGVDFYNKGCYVEAIPFFNKANQLDIKELDSLSSRRSNSAMWLASCYYKLGDERKAIQYDKLFYKLPPTDRRFTISIDSILDEAIKDMVNNRHLELLPKLQKVSEIENRLFDKYHHIHIQTNRYLAQCHLNLQQPNKAIPYIEDARRLIKHNFSETDTLQIPDILNLFYLYAFQSEFDKSEELRQELKTIIETNYPENHPCFAHADLLEINLLLTQRKWDDAKNLLPSYIETLERCCGNNPKQLKGALFNIRSAFSNCGRNEECAYIDNLLSTLNKELSDDDLVASLFLKCVDQINSKNFNDAQLTVHEIENLISKISDNDRITYKTISDCLRCFLYMCTNHMDEAKDLYLTINQAVAENSELIKPIYLTLKMTMSIALSDYESAAIAINKQVENKTPSFRYNNLGIIAQQACINAMAGNYNKARSITHEVVETWNREVIDRKAIYRLEKDTMEINHVSLLFDSYLRYTDNLPDSVRYTMRDIKSEYLLLKARILQNISRYQISSDYYECISDYVWELVKNDKYPEAQETMDTWLKGFYDTYNSIDENSENEDDIWDLLVGSITLESALSFRCRCYEKGDPAGIKAYEDLLEYTKIQYPEGENSKYYRDIMLRFYNFVGDNKGLLNYVSTIKDPTNGISVKGYETIAEAYEQIEDYSKANIFWKGLIRHLINDPESLKRNEHKLFSSIYSVVNNYTHKEVGDTILVYDFYANELWPAFDKLNNDYHKYLCKSIDEFCFKLDDDNFIKYIEHELKQRKKLKLTPYQEATIYQSIAGVLYRSENCKKLAIEYIKRGKELVKDDKTLNLLFGCYLHKIMYQAGPEVYNSCISFGNELLELMNSDSAYNSSIEYANIIERQLNMLRNQSRYNEMGKIGNIYLKYNSRTQDDDFKSIFNKEHPLYNEYSWLNRTTLHDYNILTNQRIREMIFLANSVKNPKKAAENALSVINDDYDCLETAMNINSIHTYECDKLISRTSKFAYHYQTDSLKEYAYNTSLLCKGLQLRSKNAILEIIKRSGHKGAIRKFDELQYVLNQLSSAPKECIDSLIQRRDELENDLHRLSSNFGDYKKTLNISWRDVQSALEDNDLAIEFTYVEYDYSDPAEVDYKYGFYACVLTKQMETPEIVFIAPKDSIYSDIAIYKSDRLSKLILKCLSPYLKGITNIYYSPIGKFNNIALESLPLKEDSDKTLSSKYNIYRLSSTSEIIGSNIYLNGQGAVVYGGIKYDTTIEDMVADNKKYSGKRTIGSDSISNIDMRSFREAVIGIRPLPASKVEAEGVTKTLKSSGDTLHVDLLLDKLASEASFKALDGKHKRILHIATHGFYFNKLDFNEIYNSEIENNGNIRGEDKSLMKSGLLFAGAVNKYLGEEIPNGLDDGILTSHEISNLNLTGLDLCVLSACQTAQGDISSEGVYGLQRGFKKAGAKSILMSLWEVDDEATSFMMNEFYRLWIQERKSKYVALELAKQAVRAHKDKRWDDPKYWAAFILLDGLN